MHYGLGLVFVQEGLQIGQVPEFVHDHGVDIANGEEGGGVVVPFFAQREHEPIKVVDAGLDVGVGAVVVEADLVEFAGQLDADELEQLFLCAGQDVEGLEQGTVGLGEVCRYLEDVLDIARGVRGDVVLVKIWHGVDLLGDGVRILIQGQGVEQVAHDK